MKVLFISTGDAKYGAPKSLMTLIKTLKEDFDVKCVLLTKSRNELNEWCDNNSIENYSMFYCDIMSGDSFEKRYLNFLKQIVKHISFALGKITESKVKRLIKEINSFDLIHTNSNRVDIGAYISREYNIPHIWHLREMDEGVKNMHYYIPNWYTYMDNNADRFIAISKAVKDSWSSHGLNSNKINIIYNGIDPQTIVHKNSPILEDKYLKIVSVGRIEKGKGQEDLIKAICLLPNELQSYFVVDLLGEPYDEYKKYLDEIIRKNKCTAKINYCGYCSDIGNRLKKYDVGITCSPAEAFGRTTVEYMMAGLLVIATETGANPEIIQNESTGLLYKSGDYEMLASILKALFTEKSRFNSIAHNGYQMALEKFTSYKNAENIYNLYLEILNKD